MGRGAGIGVSYGLVAAAGLLTARMPGRWARRYAAAFSALLGGVLVVDRCFTNTSPPGSSASARRC
jgi:hypothetical protein